MHLSRKAVESGATVLFVKGTLLCTQHPLRWPEGVVFHHGVQDREQLAHAGGQGDLRRFARGSQALIQPFAYRVVPDSDPRAHGQGSPDRGATAPHGAGPPQGSPVSIAGGYTDPRGEALAAQGAQLRQVEPQGPGTHGAKARHTPERGLMLAPHWAGTQGGIPIVSKGRYARVKPRHMGLDIDP